VKNIVFFLVMLMFSIQLHADTVVHAGTHLVEINAASVKTFRVKPGGQNTAMYYHVNSGRYYRSVGNVARATAAATLSGLVLIGIYEAANSYGENQQLRDFTYCRMSRTISMITGRDIYDDDC